MSIPGYAGDGSDALDAVFSFPSDIAVGMDDEIYIADTLNRCVRVLNTDGIIDRFAGGVRLARCVLRRRRASARR